MDITDTIDIEEFKKRTRPHASYFIWRGDKRVTEVGVVKDWLEARYDSWPKHFSKFEHLQPPNDPPDVILTDLKGLRHGVEVTELVDSSMIRARDNGINADSHEFSECELGKAIADRVADKSNKLFQHDAEFKSRILLIFSDELSIAYGDGPEYLSRMSGFDRSYFHEIWIMIPPAPNISGDGPGSMHCRVFKMGK